MTFSVSLSLCLALPVQHRILEMEALQHEEAQSLGLPKLTITHPMTPAGARLRLRLFRGPGRDGLAFRSSRSACLVLLERYLDVVRARPSWLGLFGGDRVIATEEEHRPLPSCVAVACLDPLLYFTSLAVLQLRSQPHRS
jgi:hypothetical protein